MASEPDVLAPLQDAVRDLAAFWAAEKVDALLIGGVAAALLGRPRVTRDVDALVWLPEGQWKDFLARSANFNLAPRADDALEFAREARVLLLRHVASQIDVDIAFAALPFERQALDRGVPKKVAGELVRLPTPEDFIIMKAVAHRPVDLADVEGVIAAHRRLDRRRIRKYLREFAALLEKPEILEEVDRLLAQRRKR
jgi:hypothetical protein